MLSSMSIIVGIIIMLFFIIEQNVNYKLALVFLNYELYQ